LLDEPLIRLVRIGAWLLSHDPETGLGEWEYSPSEEVLYEVRQRKEMQRAEREETYAEPQEELPEIPTGSCPECGKAFEPEGYCLVCDQ
jgi:hypothetical protein